MRTQSFALLIVRLMACVVVLWMGPAASPIFSARAITPDALCGLLPDTAFASANSFDNRREKPIAPMPAAPQGSTRFAMVGDYGTQTQGALNVAQLIKSWQPDFVTTLGDNNYDAGLASTIDLNIGFYYHDFIYPYVGAYGPGASTNRFFPVLGNHDWNSDAGAAPYLNYFVLPGNERYYDFVRGPVHFFMLDSDPHEPDGTDVGSVQARWLKAQMMASTAKWKVVLMHHPPYSSGPHGSTTWMQWPFKAWGATAVLAGHDHDYERLTVDGLPYFVNGAGGRSLYSFNKILPESLVRYNTSFGAMLVEANDCEMRFQFITTTGEVVDSFSQTNACAPATAEPTATPVPSATPTATPVPSATPTAIPTATSVPSATPTAIPTATPVPSATRTVRPTSTRVPSATPTAIPTSTRRPSATPTELPSTTPTEIATATPVPSETPTLTPEPTSPDESNPTPPPTLAPVLTPTPKPTHTQTPEPTTASPTPTLSLTPHPPTLPPRAYLPLFIRPKETQ